MNYYLAQLYFLAARNDDVQVWTNLLYFLVLAVVWAVGGILKAKSANKLKDQQETEQEKPQPRHRSVHRPFQIGPKKVISAKQAISQWITQTKPKIAPEPMPQPIAGQLSVPEPQLQHLQSAIEELSEFADQPDIVLQKKQAEFTIELPLFDVDDPDMLRIAILHYEILGKPLSLRDVSTEHILGL